jgi:hypothetical protein
VLSLPDFIDSHLTFRQPPLNFSFRASRSGGVNARPIEIHPDHGIVQATTGHPIRGVPQMRRKMFTLTRRGFFGATLTAAGTFTPFLAFAQEFEARPASKNAADLSGTRLVWFGASASIPGVRSQIEPDDQGNWVNRLTGQRFRQFDTPGPAGAGFMVFDVLSSEEKQRLSWSSSLLIHADAGNATTFVSANGFLSATQMLGDFWMPPAQLANFSDQNAGSMRVLRAPYSLDGKTYRAIRIQFQNADGWSQTTYDLESGLLLVSSSTTQSGPVLTLDPNNLPAVAAGNTLLTYTKIAGIRRTSLPGPGERYPAPLRRARTFNYTGSRGVIMAGTGIQVPPSPIQVRYDIADNEGPYLTARVTVTGPTGGSYELLIPAGVIGSLWMNPETLAGYKAGQVIDQDPLTGVRAIAMGTRDNLAFVSLQTGLAQQSFGYDRRTGVLSRSELRTQIGPATDVLTAQIVSMQ